MLTERLHLLLPVVLLIAVVSWCDDLAKDEDSGGSVENTLRFTNSSFNELRSGTVESDRPEKSFTATVEITSDDAIEASDVAAYIVANCSGGGGDSFAIPLSQNGLQALSGRRTVSAAFCNDQQTGQRGRVTWSIVVQRLNRFINFTAVVSGSGG